MSAVSRPICPSRRRRLVLATVPAVLLAILASTAGPGPAQAASAPRGLRAGARPVTVMTQNLYLGANLTPILTAPTPAAQMAEAARAYAHVGQTDFTARAAALATEVAATRPDLIGLQEVALWEIGPIGGELHPSYDFNKILLGALAARGLRYRVAVANTNFSGTLPIDPTMQVRFTDHDEILARSDLPPGQLKTSNPQPHRFLAQLPLPTPTGQAFLVPRGWSSVDVNVRGRLFRFADTHLEAYQAQVRAAQATELYLTLALSPLPVVLVGDFNSRPDDTLGAYGLALLAGYHDAWVDVHGAAGGNTSGQTDDLNNPVSTIDHRIDYVLYRGSGLAAVAAEVVGDEPADRTPSGLWPSDHAGVVATLALG